MLKNETRLELCGIESRIRENIARLRKERGLSVHELGRMSGIPYIARIEKGTKNIGREGVARVAHALNVDISEIYRPLTRSTRAEQMLQIFDMLTAEGQALLIETAKSIAAYEAKLKWRE